MWTYFERMENCHYHPLYRWLAKIGFNPTRHGWKGWLHTEKAVPRAALRNRALREGVVESVLASFCDSTAQIERLAWLFQASPYPNDSHLITQHPFAPT